MTNKKLYTAPLSTPVRIEAEGMMAASPFNKYDEKSESDQLSNRKQGGWNSEGWTATDED